MWSCSHAGYVQCQCCEVKDPYGTTIASAYSLRPKPGAPVSTPLDWDELDDVGDPRRFNLFTVPERFAERGDVHAAIDDVHNDLTPLVDLYAQQVKEGRGEMPYPPDYPKMPGEPPRVQPSKKVAAHWDEQGNWIGDR